MAVEDDVAAVEFTVETGLGVAAIRAAGKRAAEAGRRYMRTTISETRADGGVVGYVARGPGGVRQMALRMSWAAAGRGRLRVHLSVGEYQVERPRLFGIPVGRATVPALDSARRFAAALRAELAGAPLSVRGHDGPAALTSWPSDEAAPHGHWGRRLPGGEPVAPGV
ncbi:hypothetical protein GCU56_14300 [Geodermatophilus sabuli]|uniref:Uncharacterized protein n=1 Tax=Geodermatophilus sabuli TaxID=1564158 RepID=A0A7K3W2C2_9ACTN|nr:hypothetical protein [Geodermatophilus sabuli]NEK59039.1 hypothetical protein [Geodermatophilus sabuli]